MNILRLTLGGVRQELPLPNPNDKTNVSPALVSLSCNATMGLICTHSRWACNWFRDLVKRVIKVIGSLERCFMKA